MELYLESSRLILRSPISGDSEILARERSRDFVTRYNLYRECDAAQIERELAEYDHAIIVLKETNEVIGCISVRDDDMRYHMDSVLLQAWLTEECAYKGYMCEALDAMIDYLFRVEGHERVAGQILSKNRASIRLVEKLGFEQEGYLKRALRNSKDEVFDVVLYSLDRETYLGRK